MNSEMPSPMVISHSLSLYLEQQQLTQLALMCCFKAYRLLGIKGTSSGDLTYSIMKWYSSKEPACQEMWVQPLGQEDLLEKQMATHCSIIAWKIPQTEKPDGLQSMWSQRVRYD